MIIKNKKELLKWAEEEKDFPLLIDIWEGGDIEDSAENLNIKLSKSGVIKVMESIEKTQDASIGINWDVIKESIEFVGETKK